jgi:A/G-specific adenine glycosylase
MLQQTTVAAVGPRYEEFLRRFPDLKSLARAREDAVLRAWSGLGYYARARNLRAAARVLAARPEGDYPSDRDSWQSLPGVGSYTAAAVCSICFGRPCAVLDGNVARVLCRLFALEGDPRSPETRRRLQALAQELLAPGRPGDWNQAVMELGETVCTPARPRCPDCPLGTRCAARKAGRQETLPRPRRRPAARDLRLACLWIERAGKVLLWKRGRDETVLKGHWGLPEERHVRARKGPLLRSVRHAITRYRVALSLRRGALLGPRPAQARWVSRPRLPDFLVSSLWRKPLGD